MPKNIRELKCRIISIPSIETNISVKDSVTMKTKYGTIQQSKRQVLIHTIICSQMKPAHMSKIISRISLNIHRINQGFQVATTMDLMIYIMRSSSQWCNNIWTTKMRWHMVYNLKKTHTCISIWWVLTLEDLSTLSMAINNQCITLTLLQTEETTIWPITIAISTTAKSSNLKLSIKIIWQPWLLISTFSMRILMFKLDQSQRTTTLKKANKTNKNKKIKIEKKHITLSIDEL